MDVNGIIKTAKELMEFISDEFLKYRPSTGGHHLAGLHQPNPVTPGLELPETQKGARSGLRLPCHWKTERCRMVLEQISQKQIYLCVRVDQ